ncbi:hypothetical protein M9H77_29529 [Catharanthus roseus]|uniref:Uncharacterized protein n=1 Tax=Catharanthus roseus TaxID=4058 RepID=A0ACB9ZVZ7_CATRO|nr:hypothetical protein M9H77_29529 [Catharanthus roseus]
MTRDKHENIFQGLATRSRARMIEEENKEMVTLLERTFKIIRGRHWKGENEDQRSTKTFLISIMQVEKVKETSLEDLKDSTSIGEEGMDPTIGGKVHLTIPGRLSSWKANGTRPTADSSNRKTGDVYSKLARARSNCYKDGGYDRNAYGESHHKNGHYTHKSQMDIGNFSSRAKTLDHIPYEYCCENSP